MAQYVSYKSDLNSENVAKVQNKASNEVFKRPALAVLNSNQVQYLQNVWKDTGKQKIQKNTAGPFGFPIFEDEAEVPSNETNKEPNLPTSVTQLFSYKDGDTPQEVDMDTKENKNYWSFPDPPIVISQREKDELKWTSPFRDDIYWYLKDLETKFRPNASYMRKQPDITMNMRSVLVDWLFEVGEEYELHTQTVHLAVSYTDRFLSKMSVLRAKLQLVGTTCMFIAAKHEEIYPPDLEKFVYITDNTYTKKQILRMEHLVLKVLDFNLATPTAFAFLQLFCSMSVASEKVLLLAQYICEISLLEAEPFLMFLPSQIGASCVALARYTLGNSVWSDELTVSSGYSLDDIRVIVHCLYEKYSAISTYPQQAVCEKYKSSKFQCVAEVQCPESLVI